MKNYFKTKTKLVQYVDDQLQALNKDSVLTMTIIADTSGDYSVLTAIGALSEGIVSNIPRTS